MIVLDHLSETQRRAYLLADNRLAERAGWDEELLALELKELADAGFDATLAGFDAKEIDDFLASLERDAEAGAEDVADAVPEAPAEAVTRPGDLWLIGPHRLVCGDCRDRYVIARLFEDRKANVVITSPPYATQRQYDPTSGFEPVPPEKYVAWYKDVAAAIESVLAADGSYFLNIKAHAEEGERHTYVMDLVLAHKRQWGWRFVDEFCWRKTDDGVPGGWSNRFKNAWEPVYHFSRERKIKFRPRAVAHWSDDCFDYSPGNPKSTSGSGLLGTGPRGRRWSSRRGSIKSHRRRSRTRSRRPTWCRSRLCAMATSPSTASGIPCSRARATRNSSKIRDTVLDPFAGSGSTLIACEKTGRRARLIELEPKYCDVIIRRFEEFSGKRAVLEANGRGFAETALERGAVAA